MHINTNAAMRYNTNAARHYNIIFASAFVQVRACVYALKGPKREKLHAMHVKELIKTNYFER